MTMADNTIHDLLDEVNCADSCEAVTALCALIDELLKDIQHLELECIGTRYLLSQHMEEEQGSLLRSDILENLGRRHYGSPAYQLQFAPHGGHWCVCQRPPGGAQRPPSLRYFDRLNNNNVMLRCPLHNSVG